MVFVFYRYQHEKNQTNFYEIKNGIVTLQDIKDSFPDKQNEYHFRFKSICLEAQNKQIAYIDIMNKNAKIPIFEEAIHMKVLLLPQNSTRKQPIKIKNQQQSQKQPQQQTQQQNAPQPQQNNQKNNQNQIYQQNQQQTKQGQEQQQKQVQQNVQNYVNSQAQARPKNDLMEEKVQLSEKEKQKIKAQAEKAGQDLKNQWEAEEQHQKQKQEAGTKLEPKILKWAQKGSYRNDIRSLLATLNDVLWEGHTLKVSNLGGLLSENQKQYLLAIRICHPDKLQGSSPDKKYIAERVFYELNQGWQTFQSQKK